MRVIHTIPHIGRISAGPSLSVLNLCESLNESNNIILASTDPKGSLDQYSFIKTFPINFKMKKLEFSSEMYYWIKNNLKEKKFDIVHNHSLWLIQNLYPSWAAYQSNTPIIISPRGTLSEPAMKSGSKLKKLFWFLLQKPALKDATYFHATSLSELHDIRSHGFKQPIIQIPNGLNIPSNVTRYKEASKRKKKFLFLGRIHPIKGLENLLVAWSAFENEHPEWHLEIAGPDSYNYLSKLKQLSYKLNLNRIKFIGEVTGPTKEDLFHSSSILILPSFSENFGMVIAEALSRGIPCIASHGTPWQDLPNKNAGWWISNSAETIFLALREASLKSSKELEIMGENGKNWIMEDFSLKKNALKWNQAYNWVLSKKNKPDFIYD